MAREILDDLRWRGLLAHTTDAAALDRALSAGPVTFYCGFDPTAPSLHFGNLVQLVTMRRLQEAGHDPIAVVGGATGLIGDPSGKSAERALNEREVVDDWVERSRPRSSAYLDFAGDNPARIVNNLEWTRESRHITSCATSASTSACQADAGQGVGPRAPGGRRGSASPSSATSSCRRFDYLELHRRYGTSCRPVERPVGEPDGRGRPDPAGGRRVGPRAGHAAHHAADGTKYGKTAADTLWLDPALTSPYAFYQFFVNTADADVGRSCCGSSASGPATEIEAMERADHGAPGGARARSRPWPRS